jgi:hypothetical protein
MTWLRSDRLDASRTGFAKKISAWRFDGLAAGLIGGMHPGRVLRKNIRVNLRASAVENHFLFAGPSTTAFKRLPH